jgi:hypothetical protein
MIMELYKEKLKLENRILAVIAAILALFTVLSIAAEAGLIALSPIAGDSHWQSQWRGFICGASMGILGLILFGLVRNSQALKDEQKLKKLYIKEHDERTIQIWTAARAEAMRLFLLIGLAAAIIAGYFSITVSLTILACIVSLSLLGLGFKVYYSKKF